MTDVTQKVDAEAVEPSELLTTQQETRGEVARQPDEVCERAQDGTTPTASATRRALLLGNSPTVAGENAEQSAALSEALGREYPNATSAGTLRGRWFAEMLAWKMATLRRGAIAENCTWNAAIGESLYQKMVELGAIGALERDEKAGATKLLKSDERIEESFPQSWLLNQRRLALAAASGDEAAIGELEKRLGRGSVQINAVVDFASVYGTLGAIDRVVRPAIADCDSAFRALEKLEKQMKKRQQKTIVPQPVCEPENEIQAPASGDEPEVGVVQYW